MSSRGRFNGIDYKDYTYDGSIVTGFSELRRRRFKKSGRFFAIPDVNPSTFEPISEIGDYAFAEFRFQGNLLISNITSIGGYAFKKVSLKGSFLLIYWWRLEKVPSIQVNLQETLVGKIWST